MQVCFFITLFLKKNSFQEELLHHYYMIAKYIYIYIAVNFGTFSIPAETPQIRLEPPKATPDSTSEC